MASSTRLFITVAAACGLGTGAALAGWNYWQTWSAERVKAQAAAEAEAFKSSPQGKQREAVKRHLFNPDTAQFRNERPKDDGFTWCGEVNAQNRMGGMGGWSRYVVLLNTNPEDPQDLNLVDIDYWTHGVESDTRKASLAYFNTVWQRWCQ